jgi:hypothetical protein
MSAAPSERGEIAMEISQKRGRRSRAICVRRSRAP